MARSDTPNLGVIWFSPDGSVQRPPGPMPQLEDRVRHGFAVSTFPDFWPLYRGRAYSPRASWHAPGGLGCGAWLFSLFFLHIRKQKEDVLRTTCMLCLKAVFPHSHSDLHHLPPCLHLARDSCTPPRTYDRECAFFRIITVIVPQLTWRYCHYDK